MSLLVRKVERAKWLQNDIMKGQDASADAITNCMRTKQNALSAWRIGAPEDLSQAALAIASVCDHLDAIDLVILHEADLRGAGLNVSPSPAPTAIESLKDTHVDIVDLTYRSLGTVAGFVIDQFRRDSVRRYTMPELRKLLTDAIQCGAIREGDLRESVRRKLR